MACAKTESQASYRWLRKHHRLHLQHGPIDLVIQADGDESERRLAFEQAMSFFNTVLTNLVADLPLLRTSVSTPSMANGSCETNYSSAVARSMHAAVAPFADHFVTPMAAVAGSVAQHSLANMCQNRALSRVAVNNGGDIALHLQRPASYTIGLCEYPNQPEHQIEIVIDASSRVRGIATSGWQGRSFSFGIADAVTVLASSAAQADVAATLIANRIDLPDSQKIQRVEASSLSPDTDLGKRLVTVGVQQLSSIERQRALQAGQRLAQSLMTRGLIDSAMLCLQGDRVVVGQPQIVRTDSYNRRQIA